MKQILFVLSISLLMSFSLEAQRLAYVDSESILNSMTDYKDAQAQLDQMAAKWKQEISAEYGRIDEMYRKYQAEQVLLSESTRAQREEEIVAKEASVREMQKRRFGPEGDLFKKRSELVQPIQERVYKAVEDYANERGFDFIFDRASGSGMLFANPSLDRTDDVKKKLGIN